MPFGIGLPVGIRRAIGWSRSEFGIASILPPSRGGELLGLGKSGKGCWLLGMPYKKRVTNDPALPCYETVNLQRSLGV